MIYLMFRDIKHVDTRGQKDRRTLSGCCLFWLLLCSGCGFTDSERQHAVTFRVLRSLARESFTSSADETNDLRSQSGIIEKKQKTKQIQIQFGCFVSFFK